jgi:hypothetical protein
MIKVQQPPHSAEMITEKRSFIRTHYKTLLPVLFIAVVGLFCRHVVQEYRDSVWTSANRNAKRAAPDISIDLDRWMNCYHAARSQAGVENCTVETVLRARAAGNERRVVEALNKQDAEAQMELKMVPNVAWPISLLLK